MSQPRVTLRAPQPYDDDHYTLMRVEAISEATAADLAGIHQELAAIRLAQDKMTRAAESMATSATLVVQTLQRHEPALESLGRMAVQIHRSAAYVSRPTGIAGVSLVVLVSAGVLLAALGAVCVLAARAAGG